jgi:hypothetical protein
VLRTLRPVLVGFLGFVVVLLFPFALTSVLLVPVLTDTDAYVDTVQRVASDPAVVEAVSARLAQQATAAVERAVPGELPRGARERLDEAATTLARDAVTSDSFAGAWRAANHSAHTQFVSVMTDEDLPVVDETGRVSVELGTVLGAVLLELDERGLVDADRLPEVQTSFALIEAEDLDRAQRLYLLLDRMRAGLPALWILLLVVTLGAARRRARALAFLSLGLAVASVVLLGALAYARSVVVSPLPDQALAGAVWDAVTRDLWRGALISVLVGALGAAGAWAYGRSAQRTRLV